MSVFQLFSFVLNDFPIFNRGCQELSMCFCRNTFCCFCKNYQSLSLSPIFAIFVPNLMATISFLVIAFVLIIMMP